ncbi:MAG: hypothetical protein HOV96_38010, partial [Nonomuraea sp.]|nr:hypothetical protein [Nonomuraea sp.]
MAIAWDESAMSKRARRLLEQGMRLSEQDRSAQALDAEQQSIALYRRLAAANPGRYLPSLAKALTNVGVTLSELDRAAEALSAEL